MVLSPKSLTELKNKTALRHEVIQGSPIKFRFFVGGRYKKILGLFLLVSFVLLLVPVLAHTYLFK